MCARTASVMMRPGTIVLARIPCLPWLVATYIVSAFTPALDTPYAVRVRSPVNAAPDDMLMIDPPVPPSISGMACLQVSIWLVRLTASVRSHTSTSRSVTMVSRARKSLAVSAALLWSTSRRPNRSMVAAIAVSTCASSDTSARTAIGRSALGTDPVSDRGRSGIVDIDHRDGGTGTGERPRGLGPDASGAPGDDGDLPGQSAHVASILPISRSHSVVLRSPSSRETGS